MEFLIVMIVGTAGVWRIQAINDAGGWKDRTTVEDMDLAVRASLKGWKFVFVGDLMVILYFCFNLRLVDNTPSSEIRIS